MRENACHIDTGIRYAIHHKKNDYGYSCLERNGRCLERINVGECSNWCERCVGMAKLCNGAVSWASPASSSSTLSNLSPPNDALGGSSLSVYPRLSLYFLFTSLFNEPIAPLLPSPDLWLAWPAVYELPKAAYIACASRGDWWKDENACGDDGPVGKNPDIGEDEGEE